MYPVCILKVVSNYYELGVTNVIFFFCGYEQLSWDDTCEIWAWYATATSVFMILKKKKEK